jgi:MFS family permease
MPGTRDVLREPNFRLLFTARTISFFGTNLAPIAVAFAVLGLSNSASDVGLAFAAWTLAQVSTLLVGGVVADRLPRRLVMIASDSASFCVRSAMGALLVTSWDLALRNRSSLCPWRLREPGTLANERLTAATGVALVALLLVEGVTILFLRPLLPVHSSSGCC